jgi:murein DD-endopeptidase MepM/ murein hydrolase activator NlpD
MVRDIARQRLRYASFAGALCAVAIGAAGCSSETSRFGGGENPNGSPYAARQTAYSASYSGPPPMAAPPAPPVRPSSYPGIESQPLPQPAYSPSYGSQSYGSQYPALAYDQPPYRSPPPAMPDYAPPSAYHYEPPRQTYAPPPPAPRYEPPPRPAPDYSSAVETGTRLSHDTAPRTPAPPSRVASMDTRAPAPAYVTAPAAVLAPSAMAGAGQTLLPTPPVHTVAHGDTLGRVAYRYHVTPREVAVANGISQEAPLRVGTRLTIPVRTPTFRPLRAQPGTSAVAQARLAADPRTAALAPPPGRVAAAESVATANVHVVAPVAPPPAEAAPSGAPGFRWPARGRVVNTYGARVNGSTNDGIDLAVPEGTPVRSADDGVVAYAGNELKGYGNLVLVRHADGFVTAYANGSELLVKRNDQVHKGQVIMKSGQTGNAANPQLHFEVRKNSAPVDPMQYLPADRTASAPL